MSGGGRRSFAGPSPSYADLSEVHLPSVVGVCHRCSGHCSHYHLQNHHESPAAAGPVPGFGDEG